MNLTRIQKMILGIGVILLGFALFLDSLGIVYFSVWDLWPLILLYIGYRQWMKDRRLSGGILFALGAIFALGEWFGIKSPVGFLIACGFIYFGFTLLRSRHSQHEEYHRSNSDGDPERFTASKYDQYKYRDYRFRKYKDGYQGSASYQKKSTNKWTESEDTFDTGWSEQEPIFTGPEYRSSLFGDFYLTQGRYELNDLHIWHGIGDVKIDLSRALIPDEETLLIINGWIGDVTIYVPVDLPVSVTVEVKIGDIEVFGHRQGGLQRHAKITSKEYPQATRKVKIIVSLLIGDIDVRYI